MAPSADKEVALVRFYRCPLAETLPGTPLRQLITTHNRLGAAGVSLRDLSARATPALVDGLAVIDTTLAALHQRQAERERAKRPKGGAGG